MKINQEKYKADTGWETIRDGKFDLKLCNLVFVFGSRQLIVQDIIYSDLQKKYPGARIVLNSTSGEIIDIEVNDDTVSVTAIWFEKTDLQVKSVNIEQFTDSFEAGKN